MILKTTKYNIEVYDGMPLKLLREYKIIALELASEGGSDVEIGLKLYARLLKVDWFNKLIKKITDKDNKELDISVLEEMEDEKDLAKLEEYFSEAVAKAGVLLNGGSKKKE